MFAKTCIQLLVRRWLYRGVNYLNYCKLLRRKTFIFKSRFSLICIWPLRFVCVCYKPIDSSLCLGEGRPFTALGPTGAGGTLMGRDYFDTNIKAADQSEIRAHVTQTDGTGGHRV